jgi:hypothetical protein
MAFGGDGVTLEENGSWGYGVVLEGKGMILGGEPREEGVTHGR